MLVLFAVIVVDMSAGDEVAQGFEASGDAGVLGAFGEMRVADIEIEAQGSEPSFVYKGAKIGGIAHFAGRVFNAEGDAGVVRVQGEMFEGAESGVAFARVGGFAGAAHVQDQAGKG